MDYNKAGVKCTRCLEGQAFWVWEPVYSNQVTPPFKIVQVLKCFQCSYVLKYIMEGNKRKI